jgi:alginate O-acetyltransferase complex protein AlgI
LFGSSLPLKNIILPLGISFFTFQNITYLCDLYWNKTGVQKNPLKIALYIMFFPKLSMGPITRYGQMAEQLDTRVLSIEKFAGGVARFVIGLAKKAIIANALAANADLIFNTAYHSHSAATAWLGVVFYTLQLYFDFSGYSDMAIGLGKMFGFDLPENFNLPYISKSIREFWRRWHITLSSFFRDYVYIPMGGNRKGNVYIHLSVVFLLTGLWHGAAWNFVIWGLWHGAFTLLERWLPNTKLGKIKLPKAVQHIYAMLVVMVGWVLFRADSLSYAAGYLEIMFGGLHPQSVGYTAAVYRAGYTGLIRIIACLLACGLPQRLWNNLRKAGGYGIIAALRLVGTVALLIISSISVMTSTFNPFIYFRF